MQQVERHELKAGLKEIGYDITEPELDAMMALMDKDGVSAHLHLRADMPLPVSLPGCQLPSTH